jgi:hypothetical protein
MAVKKLISATTTTTRTTMRRIKKMCERVREEMKGSK